jgi:large subunit ribosomal protein L33
MAQKISPFKSLTKRELQVAKLKLKGLTYVDISEELGLTINTVKSYLKDIYKKLKVHSRSELSELNKLYNRKGKKSKKKAETVVLVCEETGEYNYAIRKKPGGEKLKLSKYCPKLRKHTIHNEKKK